MVRPSESIAETKPQLQPALLRLSAIISQLFTVPLLTIQRRLRRGFAQFKLCAHFLQSRSKRGNLFLLLCNSRGLLLQFLTLFLYCAVLFQKLVEQHRVHCVVTDGVWLSLFVVYH